MSDERLTEVSTFLTEINNLTDARSRIYLANRARELIDDFISFEVGQNQQAPDGEKLSWGEIGQAIGRSKSATYARYKNQKAG